MYFYYIINVWWLQFMLNGTKRAKWNASFILCMQAYSNNGCEFFFFSISFRFLTHVFLDGTHQFSHQNICTSLRFATLQPHKEYRRKYHPNPKKTLHKEHIFIPIAVPTADVYQMPNVKIVLCNNKKNETETQKREIETEHIFLWRL